MGETPWRKAAWRFGPPVIWMMVISGFSTSWFSAAQTGGLVVPFLHWLLPGVDPATVSLLHTAGRKAMHLIVFGILVVLLQRALGETWPRGRAIVTACALILTLGLAGADELHQRFVAERTGTVVDVGWDGVGATLALLARRLIWRA